MESFECVALVDQLFQLILHHFGRRRINCGRSGGARLDTGCFLEDQSNQFRQQISTCFDWQNYLNCLQDIVNSQLLIVHGVLHFRLNHGSQKMQNLIGKSK